MASDSTTMNYVPHCTILFTKTLYCTYTVSPLYDVLDHTNHTFSESLSSGGDNDQDKLRSRISIMAIHPKFSTNKFPQQLSSKHFPLKLIFHMSTHSLNIWVSPSLLGLVYILNSKCQVDKFNLKFRSVFLWEVEQSILKETNKVSAGML